MSTNWINVCLDFSLSKGPRRAVLLILAHHMNDHHQGCWPNEDTIAKEAGVTLCTVKRVLKKLEETGEISRTKEMSGGRVLRTVYGIRLSRQTRQDRLPLNIQNPPPPVEDYRDFYSPEANPVSMAVEITGERSSKWAWNTYTKILRNIGDELFRKTLATFWGEAKVDPMRNRGAVLVKKLLEAKP